MFLLISIIISSIITFFVHKNITDGGIEDIIWGVIIGIPCGLLIFLITSVVINGVIGIDFSPGEEKEIYALEDNLTNKGSYFLGSGSHDGAIKYFYLTKQDDGVVLNSIDVKNVILVENNEGIHKIVFYTPHFKNNNLDKWFAPFGERTKVFIPKGSIKYNYNVDLN
jgi:hypothetical protein